MSDDSLARRHSASVRKMFSRIAGRYDLMNRLMTFGMDRRWRRIAAQAANVPTGGVVLDLGTGTGDLALAFTRHSPAGSVIAADHSIEMLTAARSKLRRLNEGRFELPVGVDALDQPFADQTFDCVAQAFVIRNVADPARELDEILRVLKPGGTMVVLELVSRRRNLLSALADVWTEWVVPLAGRLVAGDAAAYRYLVESARAFHTARSLARLVEDAGFIDVRSRSFAIGSIIVLVAKKPD